MAINLLTPAEVLEGIAARAKSRRLAAKLTQAGLAERAGVSLGSLKRFERTGQIALASLLRIALVLRGLDDFLRLFAANPEIGSVGLDELLRKPTSRQRGSVT